MTKNGSKVQTNLIVEFIKKKERKKEKKPNQIVGYEIKAIEIILCWLHKKPLPLSLACLQFFPLVPFYLFSFFFFFQLSFMLNVILLFSSGSCFFQIISSLLVTIEFYCSWCNTSSIVQIKFTCTYSFNSELATRRMIPVNPLWAATSRAFIIAKH